MSMLNDFAFAAVDTFLKTEILKLLDQWLSETAVNQLIALIPNSGRPVPMPVRGTLRAEFSGIRVEYHGTAMRKTMDRSVEIPDQIREIRIDRMIPARPGATVQEGSETKPPLSGNVKLQTEVVLDGLGISEGMGGLRADVNSLRFQANLNLSVNQEG